MMIKFRMLLTLIFLGLLLLTATALAPAASAQESSTATLTVTVPALNVRSGPGGYYPPTIFVLEGEQATIIGQDATSGWYQVRFASGEVGWVTNDKSYVSVSGDFAVSDLAADTSPTTTPSSSPGVIVFQTEAGGAIYAVNPDGSNLRYLTQGMDPALSPDGQTVAFTRWQTSQDGALGNVWLINIDGSNERVVHEFVYNPRTPVWSADGSQLIIAMQHGGYVRERYKCSSQGPTRGSGAYDISFHRDDEGDIYRCYTLPPDPHWGLRQIDLATGAHQDLSAAGDEYSLSPTWDPLYSGHVVYDGDFGLMNVDLVDQRNWVLTEDYNDRSPVFSPDGSKIAVSYRQDDHWEVHVMNADGSGRQRLTETTYMTLVEQQLTGEPIHSHNNAAPAWSPDSSQLAFLTDRSGQWEIWLMNADGSNQRPLLTAAALAPLNLQYHGNNEQMLSWGG
jgi:uncharacterized protein YraI